MKAVCFLLSMDKKRYSLLFNNLRDGDNVGRVEYPFTMTSAMDLLILTEGVIRGNHQSTPENRGGRGGPLPKGCMGKLFSHQCQGRTE